MTNVRDASDRRNVSERAPTRTFHRLYGEVKPHDAQDAHEGYQVIDLMAADAQAKPISATAARGAAASLLLMHDEHDARTAVRRLARARELSSSSAMVAA